MGLFGRKPRMVGFGDPEARKRAAVKQGPFKGAHSGRDHRNAELKNRATAIDRAVETLAKGGPGGANTISTAISRTLWRWIWFGVLLFFVLPLVLNVIVTIFHLVFG